jgi:hypothetical protein
MSLKISSEKINNPFLVDLLEKLTDSFRKMNHDFFIIGENASPLGVKRTPGGLAFMVVQLNGLWLYN